MIILPKFKDLPIELKIIIFNYDGRIKERRGKYLDQIDTNDIKYNLVKKNLIINSILINSVQLHIKYFTNINILHSPFKNKYIVYKAIVEWLNRREVIHPFTQNIGIYTINYNISKIMAGLGGIGYSN
jgi:hypothetical protein